MYQSTIQALTTIFLVIVISFAANSQTPIYSFTFDSDLEGWTAEGISSAEPDSAANALWIWSENGDASTGAFSDGIGPIASLSLGGAIVFDSDGYDNGGSQSGAAIGTGAAPAPQIGHITSPSLDFTGQSNVILSFYQYYRYFAKDDGFPDENTADFNTPASSVEVSNDGGATWETFVLNEDITPNQSTRSTDVVTLDISSIAADQADVQVRFVWDGEYYFWIIDDVAFYAERGLDIAIINFTNIDNFESPDFVLEGDSVDLEVMVANYGDVDVMGDSIQFIARILDENRDVVFSDTGYHDTLLVNDTIIWDFDKHWVPTGIQQNSDATSSYVVVYNVRMAGDTIGEIVKPDDNVDFQAFVVRDLTLRKVPGGDGFGFNGEFSPGEVENFVFGNVFDIPEDFNQSLKLSNVFFEAFSVDPDNDPMAGKSVVVWVNKFPDNIVENNGVILAGEVNLDSFDFNTTLEDMTTMGWTIGVGSYGFSPDDDQNGGPFFIQELSDFNDDGDVILEPGNKYFIAVSYDGPANTIAQEISRDYQLYQISTLSYYPSIGGFRLLSTSETDYSENIAAIGIDLEFSTAVDENPLPVTAVKIFPNPATEYIRVDLDFEKTTDATVFIADAQGKILSVDVLRNIQRDSKTYTMDRYPSGSYIVRVATKEGTKTEHVIVTH